MKNLYMLLTGIFLLINPEPPPKPPKQYALEGVCLTEDGFKQIKSLSLSPAPMKRTRRKQSLKQGSLAILQTLADPNSELSKVIDKDYQGPEDCAKGKLTEDLNKIDSWFCKTLFQLHHHFILANF